MSAKLRECPFCGCTDVSNNDDGHTEWFECGRCGATSGYDPAPEFEGNGAAWHWNRRSDPRLAMAREALNILAETTTLLAHMLNDEAVNEEYSAQAGEHLERINAFLARDTLTALEEGK